MDDGPHPGVNELKLHEDRIGHGTRCAAHVPDRSASYGATGADPLGNSWSGHLAPTLHPQHNDNTVSFPQVHFCSDFREPHSAVRFSIHGSRACVVASETTVPLSFNSHSCPSVQSRVELRRHLIRSALLESGRLDFT